MRTFSMRVTLAVAALASSALFFTACAAGSGTETPDEKGTTSLSVGYFPVVDSAPVAQADDGGAFEAEGLDVALGQTTGGAQAIPALMAGEYDIVFSNYVSGILAAQQGLPVQVIAANNVGAADHGIVVAADSAIESVADLEGKKIAVSHLKNIGVLGISAIMKDAGADPAQAQFVELPFPDMQGALERGDIDAMWVVEPFMTLSVESGHRLLTNLFTGTMESAPVSGWFTTVEFAQQNPEAIVAFQRAIATAADELNDDRDTVTALIPTYTNMTPEQVQNIELPVWGAEIDEAGIVNIADIMLEIGFISEPFDVTDSFIYADAPR